MGFDVRVGSDALTITLSGWDRAMNWRQRIVFAKATISRVDLVDRASLERLIDHRALGVGTHNGERHPGRRRVGTMLGRGRAGKQFWAVPASDGSTPVVVIDLRDGEFTRTVLAVTDPEEVVSILQPSSDEA